MTEKSLPQRRADYRAEARLPLWYRPISPSAGDEVPWRNSWTGDLSAGGVSFEFDPAADLWRGQERLLEIQLFFPEKRVFSIARLLRRDDKGSCSAAFVSLDPEDRDLIARFALNKGLERKSC